MKVSDSAQKQIGRIRDFERQKWRAYFAEALRGEGQEHEPTLWWKVSDDDTFQIIQALFPAWQPVRVLDAACGSGGSSFLLCDRIAVRSLVFADICDTALRFARNLQPEGLAVPTLYAEADIFQLPFEDGAFDLVWNVGTIEHYPVEGIRQIVKELRRVTAKGGWIVLGIPNRNSFAVLKAYLLGTKLGRWILAGIPGYRFDSEILYGNANIRELIASEVGQVRTAFAGNCLWASAPDRWVRWTQRIVPQSRFSFLSFFCAHKD